MQNLSTPNAALASRSLMPTPACPGLWIAAEPSPRAGFACRCGLVRTAAGRRAVLDLVTQHQEHVDECRLTAGEESARRVIPATPDAAGSTPRNNERPGRRTPDLSREPTLYAA
jgi:hypothetical protein